MSRSAEQLRTGARSGEPGLVARGVLSLLRAYKRFVSPMLPPSCRYSPTCSEYAALAVRQRGVWVGTWLAAARVARCQPFAAGGLDLPPSGGRAKPASRARAARTVS